MGSSVPACPAFCASKMRLTIATACVEVMPAGLSTTTQPCTASPLRLRAIDVVGVMHCLEIALNARGFEQRLDLLGFGERIVFCETQFGREAQTNCMTQDTANVTTMAIERFNHAVRVLAAQRFAKHDRVAQIRRRLHLRDGDRNPLEIGIADITARQNFGQYVTQHLADTQLALRWPACAGGMARSRHGQSSRDEQDCWSATPLKARAEPSQPRSIR